MSFGYCKSTKNWHRTFVHIFLAPLPAFLYTDFAGLSCRGVANGMRLPLRFAEGSTFIRPPTKRKEGMPMTVFEMMTLLSFSIAVFEFGYLLGSRHKRK